MVSCMSFLTMVTHIIKPAKLGSHLKEDPVLFFFSFKDFHQSQAAPRYTHGWLSQNLSI